jgi:uncharacterized protein YegL
MQTLKEHIVFLLDASGSMRKLTPTLKSVYNKQIEALKKRNTANQEVRISVYLFNDRTRNIVFDTDCLRSPNIDIYSADGATDLVGGLVQVLNDIAKIPQLYGNYSHLVYALSDGEQTVGNAKLQQELTAKLQNPADNVTVCFLAPNQTAAYYAKNLGIPAQNIQIWNVSSEGLEDAGDTLVQSTNTYLTTRSASGGATKQFNGLFNLNQTSLTSKAVKSKLDELAPKDYELFPVHSKVQIKTFWESWHKGETYRIGSGYYQFMKIEHIQPHKQILLQEKTTGKVFYGAEVRTLLGLPNHTVKVDPANHPKYDIFVQSTAPNRNLIPGTKVIFLK